MYYPPYCMQSYGYRTNSMEKTYKTLDEAMSLVKMAIQGEREDEHFYNYLISAAPTQEEKDIITSIRNDEIKHNKLFREICLYYTGENITSSSNVDFNKPKFYLDGIKKAKFGELAAVEKYRNIRAGIPDEYFRDMVFEILTDELKHAHKYDYILYMSIENKLTDKNTASGKGTSKGSFTNEEAMQIAKTLGIDFKKERFDLTQFRIGLNTELEHGRISPATNVTGDDPILTGKIALAHLREFPDYYTRLSKLEEEAKAYWSKK